MMDFQFVMQEPITMLFQVGGAAPAPPTPSDAFPSVTSNVFRVEDNALIGEVTSDLSYGYGNWSYNNGADDIMASASVSIPASEKPGTLAVCCMHRDTVTISGDGWIKLVDGVPATYSGINQYITVWTKSRAGSREAETITITQASSIRMALRVFDFYGANVSLSVAGDEKIGSFPYTPVANTGKRRLYLTSAIYAGGSQCITLQSGFARTYANVRFCAFVDYMAGATDTPTFAFFTSYDANSANCLTLDITVNGEQEE